ncbi:MAG: alpha/beta fold hydrolase [Endozoicomonas sp. (ex Botrylloides leachii)]|nr:alpha/beta fold hydrolase [Endozoicomonas sp. (ex Botrylloides leachii)]
MHQNISFTSQRLTIAGHLYLPEKGHKPFPLVILCHGFCGVKELLIPNYADYFSRHGYAVLTFDYRGFGESQGEQGRLQANYQIDDILSAIDYGVSLNNIDPERIALWGTSFGGANAVVAAAKDHRIKCLLIQLAFADGERVITGRMSEEEKLRLQKSIERMKIKKSTTGREMMVPIAKILSDPQSVDFYKTYRMQFPALGIKIPFLTIAETMQHKPEQYIKDIAAPVMIVAAENDGVNPAEESKRLYALASEPKQLHIEAKATHYELYNSKHFNHVVNRQLKWLKAHC